MSRPSGPWMSVRLLWPFFAAVRSHGGDVGELLAGANLGWSDVLDGEAEISHATALDLIASARRSLGIETLGLDAARWNVAVGGDLLEFTAATSPSMFAGADVYREHAKLLHQAVEVHTEVEGEHVVCSYRWSGADAPREAIDFALAWTVLGFDRFTEERPQIVRAEFTYARPRDVAPYHVVFGPNVVFGSRRNAVLFHREIYERPPSRRDPQLHAVLRSSLERLSTTVRAPSPFRDQVADAVREAFEHDGPLTVGRVAKRFAIGASTLRAQLHQEGTSFSEVLDEVRFQLAARYLDETDLGTTEISEALGFSHPNAFLRAFKRWTGQTSKQYRARRVRPNRPSTS